MQKKQKARWQAIGVISLLIGSGIIIGCGIGNLVNNKVEEKPIETEQIEVATEEKEFVLYGQYDDRCFESEISLDWGEEFDFKPIDCDLDPEAQEFSFYLCKGYNLDWTLVMAMMKIESNYKTDLISSTNDYGLMQINKCNHSMLTEKIGVTDYLDADQNIRAGCFILRKMFEKYEEPELVLMCYNMGENGAKKLWENGIYSSNYSRKVIEEQKKIMEVNENE